MKSLRWVNFRTFIENSIRMFNNGWRKASHVMSDYLNRIGAGFIIDNNEVLDFDFVPNVIVGREDLGVTQDLERVLVFRHDRPRPRVLLHLDDWREVAHELVHLARVARDLGVVRVERGVLVSHGVQFSWFRMVIASSGQLRAARVAVSCRSAGTSACSRTQ